MDARKRQKLFLSIGITAIILFILLRGYNHYGDPRPWLVQKDSMFTLISFLNVNKYPPSLDYFLMTLGPGLIFLALTESVSGASANFLKVYGRVPFFYYVVHFYIIHLLCVIAFYATGYNSSQIIDPKTPFFFRPLNFGFELPAVYLIWLFVVLILYQPCRWYYNYKLRHSHWLLKYM